MFSLVLVWLMILRIHGKYLPNSCAICQPLKYLNYCSWFKKKIFKSLSNRPCCQIWNTLFSENIRSLNIRPNLRVLIIPLFRFPGIRNFRCRITCRLDVRSGHQLLEQVCQGLLFAIRALLYHARQNGRLLPRFILFFVEMLLLLLLLLSGVQMSDPVLFSVV